MSYRQTFQLINAASALLLSMQAFAGAADEEINASALLRAGNYQALESHYSGVQQEFDEGRRSGDELRNAFRVFYPTDADLAGKFDGWLIAYPKSYVGLLARGIYYKRVAWERRGERRMSETTSAQIDGMDEAMRKAVGDLGASVPRDPKPFLSFFQALDIGRQYLSISDSRKLFDQGAKLDPNSMGLRTKYMAALEPRWGGNTHAMRAFLEESKKTLLSVADLHELESMVYEEEGNDYHANRNFAEAETAYRKAISLGACSCGNIRQELFNVLFETLQFDAAITELNKYLKENPKDLWALPNRGVANLNSGRVQEGVRDLKTAAEAGDSFSQNKLGMLYLRGSGEIKPDVDASLFWLRKAAAQGESEAVENLPIAEKAQRQ